MFSVDLKTTIHRPIEMVFQRLIAIDDYTEWLPRSRIFLECKMTSPDPVREGTTFTDRTRFGQFHGEVTELTEPTKVVFHNRLRRLGITLMESWPAYELEPIEDGETTRVHHYGTGKAYGPLRLLEPFLYRLAQEEREHTLNHLKSSLERETTD